MPAPGRGPDGETRGFADSDASLARNLLGAMPTEHVSRVRRATSARMFVAISRPEPILRRAPVTSRNGGGATEPVRLSTRGTLWSYTSAGYQPPAPYIAPPGGFEPFAIAAVELAEEGLVVLGQVPSDVGMADLKVGMEMELVIDTLFVDDDGERVVWKWPPAANTTASSNATASGPAEEATQ